MKQPQLDKFYIPEPPVPGEIKLLIAILERAVSDALGATMPNFAEHRTMVRKARAWLLYSDLTIEGPAPFTLAWICDHLKLDVHKIRAKIKADIKRGRKYIRPISERRLARCK